MGADPVALEARTETVRACPRCGESFEMPERGPGRRPLWCSPRCRRAASAERLAARNAGAAVRVVEVPRAHRPDPDARLPMPSMATLARLFLSSDYQCRTLLEDLAHRYGAGTIGGELAAAVERFAAAVGLHQALSSDPAYRQAHAEVERLREHLARDAQHRAERDQELARLRAQASEVRGLRARVAQLESVLAGAAGHPHHEAGRHDQVPPAVSRQQRRAAQRAARKSH